ncbi:MAG: hypothetical protein PHP62_03465 [Candidatus Moranbacteria bacterium]|nr:hypothetical protein [Candidatus Moranbacteria bacterium]
MQTMHIVETESVNVFTGEMIELDFENWIKEKSFQKLTALHFIESSKIEGGMLVVRYQ